MFQVRVLHAGLSALRDFRDQAISLEKGGLIDSRTFHETPDNEGSEVKLDSQVIMFQDSNRGVHVRD